MSRYAADTSVSVDRSQAEIQKTLARYGADDIIIGQSSRQKKGMVQFVYRELPILASIPIFDRDDPEFKTTPSGRRRRNADASATEWEKACRQQWRVLLLLIKAKIEAIENGVVQAEVELQPWLMLPSGDTLGNALASKVHQFIAGTARPMLPEGRG